PPAGGGKEEARRGAGPTRRGEAPAGVGGPAQARRGRAGEEAVRGGRGAYGAALKLFPSDPDALKGLVAARAAIASAGTSKDDAEKRRADLARLVKEGKAAMEAKQFALAVRLYE